MIDWGCFTLLKEKEMREKTLKEKRIWEKTRENLYRKSVERKRDKRKRVERKGSWKRKNWEKKIKKMKNTLVTFFYTSPLFNWYRENKDEHTQRNRTKKDKQTHQKCRKLLILFKNVFFKQISLNK